MNDNEPKPQSTPDYFTILLEVIVGVALVYFLGDQIKAFFGVIVDATLVPLLTAAGL